MSGTPDMLTQFGGQPVGANPRYDGWWGGEVFFVDFDNGTAGATGLNDMKAPGKDIQRALDAAGADATVYVRPRAFSDEDPQAITPSSADAANWDIPVAATNMSLIGTGKGLGHAAAHKAYLSTYTSLTTPIITIHAPGCVIEGFRSQPAGTATSGIFYSINDGTYNGGNTTFVNNDFHGANTTGAINTCSCWQMSYVGNRFVNCDVGIYSTSSYSVPQIVQVWNNTFVASCGEVQNDVYFAGSGVKRFLHYRNYHGHGIPALGGTNVYVKLNATSSGAVMNNFFGAEGTTDTNFMTLSGCVQGGNYSSDALIVT